MVRNRDVEKPGNCTAGASTRESASMVRSAGMNIAVLTVIHTTTRLLVATDVRETMEVSPITQRVQAQRITSVNEAAVQHVTSKRAY